MDDFKEMAERIRNMSDAELETAIRTVGAALGADARTLDRVSREKETLRRKIGGANGREIEKIAAGLTPEQIEAVRRAVAEGKDDG